MDLLKITIHKLCARFDLTIRKLNFLVQFKFGEERIQVLRIIQLHEWIIQSIFSIEWLFTQLYSNVNESIYVRNSLIIRIEHVKKQYRKYYIESRIITKQLNLDLN
jgi:hypothetical protein